jgi:hypothetical protein
MRSRARPSQTAMKNSALDSIKNATVHVELWDTDTIIGCPTASNDGSLTVAL